jgi:hypothetical protein
MSKLYVFAIGGTGSRVLKSLSFLLASGVKSNFSTIIPIIIDPDAANGDLTRTIDILKTYQKIRKELPHIDGVDESFYKSEIRDISQNFKLNIQSSDKKFKEYIDYSSLDQNNQALTSMLFSEANLESKMDVGFKGNPNIGSVVLNQFQNSGDYLDFQSTFEQGDKIFIISSIFGGTGAAGFPLLLKNLRSAKDGSPNHALLKSCPIGAISVLPYFGVKPSENSNIDKSTFISKTKAALNYYEHNVTNGSINNMYYVGDNISKDYENIEGNSGQKNDAHFIELISALAILDFANKSDYSESIVKEFGIEREADSLNFNDLADITKRNIFKPLSQYFYFNLFISNELKKTHNLNYGRIAPIIDDAFFTSDFYNSLSKFNSYFDEWLKELKNNRRGFHPFELNPTTNEIFNYINDIAPRKDKLFGSKNYERFVVELNKVKPSLKIEEVNQNFVSLFYKATSNLITEKFNQ